MEPEEVENRKDAMIYMLLLLNEKSYPVDFSKFFFESGYQYGLESFESLMEDMESEGWIKIKRTPSGNVQHLPFLKTIKVSYEITLNGIEYLASIGKIKDKHSKKTRKKGFLKIIKGNIKEIIIGIIITVLGSLIVYLFIG
jgi:DNA-binding PadR family transcriptional regulator